jgi:hypothetical protein
VTLIGHKGHYGFTKKHNEILFRVLREMINYHPFIFSPEFNSLFIATGRVLRVDFVFFVTLIGHKGHYGFTKNTTKFFFRVLREMINYDPFHIFP